MSGSTGMWLRRAKASSTVRAWFSSRRNLAVTGTTKSCIRARSSSSGPAGGTPSEGSWYQTAALGWMSRTSAETASKKGAKSSGWQQK
jgi:hypothetical protein